MPATELQVRAQGEELLIRADGRTVASHSARRPMISVGSGAPRFRESHGNYRIRPMLDWKKPLSRAEVLSADTQHAELRFSTVDGIAVRLLITADTHTPGTVHASITSASSRPYNRIWLRLPAGRREPTYGCGEQYSRFNLRGSRLPLWTSEQGVGRGFNVTTLAANLHSSAGGHWHSTYFPQPSYVTETGRLVHLESDAYARFDFAGARDILEVWQPELRFVLSAAGGLEQAVSRLSTYLGRQPRLPEWTHTGMWLGLQGGSDVIRAKVDRAQAAGLPLSALWVQDWVGRRVTAFGSQLFWDWRYDRKLYPDLPRLIEELRGRGLRFLGYINPFLAIEGELYKEASAKGYCIKKPDGSDYLITVTTFPAAKVDLTNPEAWEWLKRVIGEQMLGIGLSGWMADYGEYLPADAVLANGDAREYHNRYPAEWARLNYEAVRDAGKLDDTAIFMRAGYTGSSRATHAVWAGDQMVDWSRPDGLPSVVPAALSAGMVGIGVSHSDVGGFTSLFAKKRSKELLLRWAEHAAFTPIMRSHESNRPADNWQWDHDEETTAHIARMARLYVALTPYRKAALTEYYDRGLPVMRPTVLHYPATRKADRMPYRYLLGRDVLVQPVVRKGQRRAAVRLPEDEWIHLWTGDTHHGGRVVVDAPLGMPPVFYRAQSEHAATIAAAAHAGPGVHDGT